MHVHRHAELDVSINFRTKNYLPVDNKTQSNSARKANTITLKGNW